MIPTNEGQSHQTEMQTVQSRVDAKTNNDLDLPAMQERALE